MLLERLEGHELLQSSSPGNGKAHGMVVLCLCRSLIRSIFFLWTQVLTSVLVHWSHLYKSMRQIACGDPSAAQLRRVAQQRHGDGTRLLSHRSHLLSGVSRTVCFRWRSHSTPHPAVPHVTLGHWPSPRKHEMLRMTLGQRMERARNPRGHRSSVPVSGAQRRRK